MYELYHGTADNVFFFILVCNVLCKNHLLSWANHRNSPFNYVTLSNNGRTFVLYSKYNHESKAFLYVVPIEIYVNVFRLPLPPPTV